MSWYYRLYPSDSLASCLCLDTAVQAAPSSSLTKTKVNKKGVNYASVTCGAKMLTANSEATNAVFLLMENKDQYMINPCKAKKL